MLFNNEMYRCMLLKSAIMKNDDVFYNRTLMPLKRM